MFDATQQTDIASQGNWNRDLPPGPLGPLLQGLEPKRRLLNAKEYVFRAGQVAGSLFLVNSGVFKTSVSSGDGREKITGFRMRGELLGIDSIGQTGYAADACALATGEVWEYSMQQLASAGPAFQQRLTAVLASEIRRDWRWMLDTGSLCADKRVVAFLLDLSGRLQEMGFSGHAMSLHMTRSDIGNFLALQLETVVRAMSRLQSLGLIGINGREIILHDAAALHAMRFGAERRVLRAA